MSWRLPSMSWFAALFAGAIVVCLEALFRVSRLVSIGPEWDAWAFWVAKAKALYFFGELDGQTIASLPEWTVAYPPGLPAMHAVAFHAMGSPDVVTLYVQFAFYALGFVTAVVGLLAGRVRDTILFPLLAVVLLMPSLLYRLISANADVPLGYLVAVGALALVLWLDERLNWQLVVSSTLLAGAILTKREGLLLAACVFVAGFVASLRDRRDMWPRLAVAAVVVFFVTVPWRIWFTLEGVASDGPTAGYLGAFDHLHRVWPSVELVVTTFVDRDLWLFMPVVAAVSTFLAALAGTWRLPIFTCAFTAAALVGATWVIWADPAVRFTQDNAGSPIVRLTGTSILLLALLTPLLLERALVSRESSPRRAASAGDRWWNLLLRRSRGAWAIVLAAALVYPASALVGYRGQTLPGGFPSFPSSADCVRAPVPGERVRVVVGYADSYPEANNMRRRAVSAGLEGTDVEQDGCGRLRVSVDDVPTTAASQRIVAAVRASDLSPTVELDPDD